MSRLSDLEVFVQVVETGSFTAAAKALEMSKSQVSRRLSALEDRLGARLLNRTTRRLATTDEGAAFHARGLQLLADLEEAEQAVASAADCPRGTVKLSLPTALSRRYLAALTAEFMERYPEVNVVASASDRFVDLVGEGFDLAVRVGAMEDSSLVARRLATAHLYVCASPVYLDRYGTPKSPQELAEHRCLLFTYSRAGSNVWQFSGRGGDPLRVQVDGPLRHDSDDLATEAALRGLGIVVLPDFIVRDHLRSGDLVAILRDWPIDAAPVRAVYPHNRHLSARVRAYVDFLAARLDPAPWAVDLPSTPPT